MDLSSPSQKTLSEIPVINEYKFLGIIFDKKLSFIPHIKYLKNKSTRAQQLLRVVAHTEWGADSQTLSYIELFSALNLTMAISYIDLPGNLSETT